MSKRNFIVSIALLSLFAFAFLVGKVYASLSFSSTSIIGTASSVIDAGSGNSLSFQTISNGSILTGTGNIGVANISPSELLTLGTAGGTRGVLSLAGNTSGKVIIQPASAAGSWTLTLPTTTGTNGQVLTTNGSGITNWTTTPPYKVYVALLNQAGTAAPVATVLENTTGTAVTWQRDGVGNYAASGPAWPINKTFILMGPSASTTNYYVAERLDTDFVNVISAAVLTAAAGDGKLDFAPIEIRIYP